MNRDGIRRYTGPHLFCMANRNEINPSSGFKKLLLLLDADSKIAAEKYELLRLKLITYFRMNRIFFPEDLADQVLERLAIRAASSEPIENAQAYAHVVAKNLLQETALKEKRQTDAIQYLYRAANENAEPFDEDFEHRRFSCMKQCLQGLNRKERDLMVQYYSSKIRRQNLANREKSGVNALRIRIHRIRAKLQPCLQNCLEAEVKSFGKLHS